MAEIPQSLRTPVGDPEVWQRWLDRLPGIVDDLCSEWELAEDGPAWPGTSSLVLPVRTSSGLPAAVKVGYDGDDESEHEALALRHWDGVGAVRLLRADPRRRALLLERLGPDDLGQLWDVEACEVIGGLLPRIRRPAPPQLRPVQEYVDRWLDDLDALGGHLPVPPRLIDQARSLGRSLGADPTDPVIVHGDLHFGNVLAAEREPWLVIDPKPMAGDQHYEVAPVLWNRWSEAVETGDLRRALRTRFHTVIDTAGLEEARARDWVIVRAVINAGWTFSDARAAGRGLSRQEQAWVTRCVSIAKAVQD